MVVVMECYYIFSKRIAIIFKGAELGVSENIIINKIKIPIADSNKIFSYKKI